MSDPAAPYFAVTCLCGATLTTPVEGTGVKSPVDCACGRTLYVYAHVVQRKPDGSALLDFRGAEITTKPTPYVSAEWSDGCG